MRKAFVEPVALPEPRFRDGLGIRYVRTDGTDDPVEVLRPLWDVGMMQNAIRQRVSRLASFRQARFVPVRAAEVPRDDASTIEVVSDYLSGHRLSQYLEASQGGAVSIETSTAIYVLRELLGALALLHESRGVTHGAVGPERILITPKGRVVVADYVLGPAIERLEFTRPRLWREFRIPMPAGKGLPKLDDKADVLQVGVTALALLLGRPLEHAEYPDRLESLLSTLGQTQKAAGRSPLPPALVGWLKRALFRDPNGKFANVSDARLTLEGVLSKQDTASAGAAALKSLADAFGRHAAALEARAAAAAAEKARKAALAAEEATKAALQEQAAAEAAAAPLTELVPAFAVAIDALPVASGAAATDIAPVPAADTDEPVGWRVPEAPPEEETLPTSPLLRIEEPAVEPVAEAFLEEVLDLAGIAETDGASTTPAEAALAAGASPAPAEAAAVQSEATGPSPAGGEVEIIVDLRDLDAAEAPGDLSEAAAAAAESGPEILQAVEEAAALAAVATPPVFDQYDAPEGQTEATPPFPQVREETGPLVPAQPVAAPAEPTVVAVPVEDVLTELEAAPAPPPSGRSGELPEWRLLADPLGAIAPTIDVEVPTETLDELVAAFAAPAPTDPAPPVEGPIEDRATGAVAAAAESAPVEQELPAAEIEPPTLEREAPAIVMEAPILEQEAPAVEMEPPAIMVHAPVPFLEPSAALAATSATQAPTDDAAAAAPSVLDEILGLQEAQAVAQAAAHVEPEPPRPSSDIAAWSFVEELLHHDARFERQAADEGAKPVAARDNTAAPAEEAAPAIEPAAPALPADWFIEVGPQPAATPPVFAGWIEPPPTPSLDVEAPPAVPPPPALDVPAAAAAQIPREPFDASLETSLRLPPIGRRPVLPEPDEDLSGPVFPRVAPSVRRVRAEARRRRLARIGSSISRSVTAFVSGCASAASAIVGGVGAVLSAAGRGAVAVVAAILTGVVASLTAVTRGVGGLLRGTASALAAVAGGVAAGSAAAVRGIAAVGRAAGSGAFRLTRASFRACGVLVGAVSGGTVRVLRALGSAAMTFTVGTSNAALAAVKAIGRMTSAAARATASMLAASGRAASAAFAGTARGAGAVLRGAGGIAGRAAGQAASTASAAGTLAGRGAVATGKGVGRAATSLPARLYFAVSDLAERLPRPVLRPWYLAAALLVIVGVAGMPYAKALLSTVRPEVGTIRVESARPDELVTIDGVPQGRAPVTASLPAGRHRIEVGLSGRMRVHEVEVSAGRETLLQSAGTDLTPTGSIRVTTDPAGADVMVDGVLHGTSPLTIDNLAEGAHTLLVRDKSGSVRQTVRVKADEAVETTVQIRPGWLAVFAPVKLEILENGRPIGSTEGGRVLTSPGPHTIEVVSQTLGFRETRNVDIRPGVVSAVTIQLPPVAIEIVAPAEAEILVDGEAVGQAPLAPLQVAVGTREITMRHPTLGERRQVVSVTYTTPVKVIFE